MKASTQMAQYTVYVPLNDNDGKPIPAPKLRWAANEMTRFAGGCTLLPPGDGLWIADGQLYRDRVVPIQVVARVDAEMEWCFRRLAGELAVLLAQHEIFIHCTPVSVLEMIEPVATLAVTAHKTGKKVSKI